MCACVCVCCWGMGCFCGVYISVCVYVGSELQLLVSRSDYPVSHYLPTVFPANTSPGGQRTHTHTHTHMHAHTHTHTHTNTHTMQRGVLHIPERNRHREPLM